jgi:hypothetical protein
MQSDHVSHRRSMIRVGIVLLLPLMLAACNPFVTNYSGEKWPAVKTATVVMTPPDPASVEWIGRSDFTSTATLRDVQAIAAAKEVGADFVEWSDTGAGKKLQWTSEPISVNAWSGNVGMIPLPVIRDEYRYQARFYRSKSLAGGGADFPRGHSMPEKVPPVKTDDPAETDEKPSKKD